MAEAKKVIGGGLQLAHSRSEQRPTRKHVIRMELTKAANGGVTVKHHYAHGPGMMYEEPTEHAFGKAEANVEKTMIHAFHADTYGPAVLFAACLRIAGHGYAFGFCRGSLACMRFLSHRGSVALELSCWIFCAGANMSSSANCKSWRRA